MKKVFLMICFGVCAFGIGCLNLDDNKLGCYDKLLNPEISDTNMTEEGIQKFNDVQNCTSADKQIPICRQEYVACILDREE